MADFIRVEGEHGRKSLVNLDYVLRVEPHERGSLIVMTDGTNVFTNKFIQEVHDTLAIRAAFEKAGM